MFCVKVVAGHVNQEHQLSFNRYKAVHLGLDPGKSHAELLLGVGSTGYRADTKYLPGNRYKTESRYLPDNSYLPKIALLKKKLRLMKKNALMAQRKAVSSKPQASSVSDDEDFIVKSEDVLVKIEPDEFHLGDESSDHVTEEDGRRYSDNPADVVNVRCSHCGLEVKWSSISMHLTKAHPGLERKFEHLEKIFHR